MLAQLEKAMQSLAPALVAIAQHTMRQKLGDTALDDTVQVKVTADELDLLMADYAMHVDAGRKPGKQPPLSVILAWLRRKGVRSSGDVTLNQLAYLIARSIARRGTRPKPFLAHVADDLEAAAAKYLEQIAADLVEDVLERL